jgi:hypothetical protein
MMRNPKLIISLTLMFTFTLCSCHPQITEPSTAQVPANSERQYHEYTGTFSIQDGDNPQELLSYISDVVYYEFQIIDYPMNGTLTRYHYRIITKNPTELLVNHRIISESELPDIGGR